MHIYLQTSLRVDQQRGQLGITIAPWTSTYKQLQLQILTHDQVLVVLA